MDLELTKGRYAKLINREGHVVDSSVENIQTAVDYAKYFEQISNFSAFLDQPGATSWPVPAVNYIVLRTDIQSKLIHLITIANTFYS
jgi:hypothetical protein